MKSTMDSTLALILFASILKSSIAVCPPGSDPALCGQAQALRGQSHIGIPAACFAAVDSGPCAQDLIRIFYDSSTFTCKAFSYSGCGGNANRFVSVKNCYKLCHPFYRQRFVPLSDGQESPPPIPLPAFVPKPELPSLPSLSSSPDSTPSPSSDTSSPAETMTSSPAPPNTRRKRNARQKRQVDYELENIQSESYKPIAGDWPLPSGEFWVQPLEKERVFLTDF